MAPSNLMGDNSSESGDGNERLKPVNYKPSECAAKAANAATATIDQRYVELQVDGGAATANKLR
jgi:hypothetical protein